MGLRLRCAMSSRADGAAVMLGVIGDPLYVPLLFSPSPSPCPWPHRPNPLRTMRPIILMAASAPQAQAKLAPAKMMQGEMMMAREAANPPAAN